LITRRRFDDRQCLLIFAEKMRAHLHVFEESDVNNDKSIDFFMRIASGHQPYASYSADITINPLVIMRCDRHCLTVCSVDHLRNRAFKRACILPQEPRTRHRVINHARSNLRRILMGPVKFTVGFLPNTKMCCCQRFARSFASDERSSKCIRYDSNMGALLLAGWSLNYMFEVRCPTCAIRMPTAATERADVGRSVAGMVNQSQATFAFAGGNRTKTPSSYTVVYT
jgi:hypothetical protein